MESDCKKAYSNSNCTPYLVHNLYCVGDEYSDCAQSERRELQNPNDVALRQQKNLTSELISSVNVQSYPLLKCINIESFVVPLLRLALGLENDACSKIK